MSNSPDYLLAWAQAQRGANMKPPDAALHEHGIFSKTVGPKGQRAKGYREADFAEAWKRYLTPQEERPAYGNLPFTRSSHCNGYTFGGKSAVHQVPGEREKIDGFPNDINVVNGCTEKNPEINPSLESAPAADDGLDIPD